MSHYLKLCTTFIILTFTNSLLADGLFMVRSNLAFPEAMTVLQNSLIKHGYKISRVQRVDVGLTKNKYKTDKYRVVFYGKAREVGEIANKYPDFIPYLPLKIAIFAEGEQTLLVATNPDEYERMYKEPGMSSYFKRWKTDLRSVLKDVVTAK